MLSRMDMFFHIASIERDIYWQLGNVTCSAYPLKYLDYHKDKDNHKDKDK